MGYKHNIETDRDAVMPTNASVSGFGIQVVVGTAPVNLVDDPASTVNVPILVSSRAEAKAKLGDSNDFEKYTLMQSVYASFRKFAVAPVVFINVLDPAKHKAAVASSTVSLTNGKATLEDQGILKASVMVAAVGSTTAAVVDVDYVLDFDENGQLVIAVTPDGTLAGATQISVGYSKLDPSAVTNSDIIGGTDAQGNRTGIDVLDIVYNKLKVIPSMILAPGFSSVPAVAAALEAKAELIGSLFNSVALVDIESTTTRTWTQVEAAKQALGVSTRWATAIWPMAKMDGHIISGSAVLGALLQSRCIANNDVPCDSQDNKDAMIDGAVLADGSELMLTLEDANDYIVAKGVVTFLFFGGWKVWGSNSCAYPANKDSNNRYTKCVLMNNYLENRFKAEYLSHLGNNGNRKEMESIVNNFNMALNALVPDKLAGAEISFNREDNPDSEIMEGHWKFRTRYADYLPTEYIKNVFTWDSSILTEALFGGE